jgi:hypothetical protein
MLCPGPPARRSAHALVRALVRGFNPNAAVDGVPLVAARAGIVDRRDVGSMGTSGDSLDQPRSH